MYAFLFPKVRDVVLYANFAKVTSKMARSKLIEELTEKLFSISSIRSIIIVTINRK